MSLHSGLPSTNGSNEIAGGGYGRVQATFLAPTVANLAGGTTAILFTGGSYGQQSFANLPLVAAGLPFLGIWASNTAGTFFGAASTSLNLATSIPSAATVTFGAGSVSLTVS
jgi:hypothetical protein